MYRSSPLRSTLNTGYITGLGMCKVCTEAVHCVALWTRVTLGLGMCPCQVCTEARDATKNAKKKSPKDKTRPGKKGTKARKGCVSGSANVPVCGYMYIKTNPIKYGYQDRCPYTSPKWLLHQLPGRLRRRSLMRQSLELCSSGRNHLGTFHRRRHLPKAPWSHRPTLQQTPWMLHTPGAPVWGDLALHCCHHQRMHRPKWQCSHLGEAQWTHENWKRYFARFSAHLGCCCCHLHNLDLPKSQQIRCQGLQQMHDGSRKSVAHLSVGPELIRCQHQSRYHAFPKSPLVHLRQLQQMHAGNRTLAARGSACLALPCSHLRRYDGPKWPNFHLPEWLQMPAEWSWSAWHHWGDIGRSCCHHRRQVGPM